MIHTILRAFGSDDRPTDDRASGADDVAGPGQMFGKLRFQMIADTLKTGTSYVATLRIFSRARRVSQRENNLVVYLTDDRNRRYDALPDKSAVPFNVQLGPEESMETTRTFEAPGDAKHVGAVIAHEGGFPIAWFIVGEEAWFRKPTVVQYDP